MTEIYKTMDDVFYERWRVKAYPEYVAIAEGIIFTLDNFINVDRDAAISIAKAILEYYEELEAE